MVFLALVLLVAIFAPLARAARPEPRLGSGHPGAARAASTGSAPTAPAATSSRGCSSRPGSASPAALVALVVAAVIGVSSAAWSPATTAQVVRQRRSSWLASAADGAARHRRAAGRPRGARPVDLDVDGDLRRPVAPAFFRLVYARGHRGPRTSSTSTPPASPASATPASSAATSSRVVRAPVDHPGRGGRRHRHRHPGRTGVPRPRRPERAHLGRHAQRRLRQHLHQADHSALAEPGDRPDLYRAGPARQRHARRARAQRRGAASADVARRRGAADAGRGRSASPSSCTTSCPAAAERRGAARRQPTSRSATTSPTAR